MNTAYDKLASCDSTSNISWRWLARSFLERGFNVLTLFFILQSSNEVLLGALFQRVVDFFFFNLRDFMPKTALHLKFIICASVSIGNQVAKLDKPLKERLKNSKLSRGLKT